MNVYKYIPIFLMRLTSLGKKSLAVVEKPDFVFCITSIDLFTPIIGNACGKRHVAVLSQTAVRWPCPGTAPQVRGICSML